GRLHRRAAGQVHFHELGGVDAIVDVVGTCAALDLLGVDDVWASPVATGTGMVRSAHGMLPNPAPAVVALLRGAPTYGRDVSVELVTPTGAALLAALAVGYGPLPAMTIAATGFGAGSRAIDGLPNATQVVLGESTGEGGAGGLPGRVKGSTGRVKVEHDDAARAARRSGLPLREVVAKAESAWRRRQAETPSGPGEDAG